MFQSTLSSANRLYGATYQTWAVTWEVKVRYPERTYNNCES